MRHGFRILAGLLLVAGVAAGAWLLRRDGGEPQARLIAGSAEAEGFARAAGPRPLDFPADHGPHPDYQTEWWYYTGNLTAADGRHFGYQLTFFRRALLPAEARAERDSNWAADQVYMAHFALTDVSAGRFHAFERLARGSAGLAGAEAPPFQVWLEGWRVEEVAGGAYRLRAEQDGLALDLELVDAKGPVLQGEQGYSQKGPETGNASIYVSLTRLETSGTVSVPDGHFTVSGLSWMDHEFSTRALSAGQIGWDWFSIQLDDGTELMLYPIRQEDGSVDFFSKGTFVADDGATNLLRHAACDYQIEVLGTWRSPRTGAVYPARWRIEVPAVGLWVEVEPWLSNQELDVSYAYWEGAVRVRGERNGQPVSGNGYVELTGYAESMEGQF
jgi:predicted secreted hydrolase